MPITSKRSGKPTKSKKSTVSPNSDISENGEGYNMPDSDLESEADPIEQSINHKIQAIQTIELRELLDFFNDAKMITTNGDASTNIVNRYLGKCYKVPDKKIPKMFKLLEACRRSNITVMYNEKQQDYSGVMFDFDIYQEKDEDQLTDEVFYTLCHKIVDLLMKVLSFKNKKELIYIGITRRPKIIFNEEKECFKDGFHVLIPGIKITRGVKRLLINKLIENELVEQILSEVEPAKIEIKPGVTYQRKDFLDVNSACVPVFFIGSASKKGHRPYLLTHVYEITANIDTKDIMLVRNESMLKKNSANICYEFSLNYEQSGGYIKKQNYEVQDKYATEIHDLEKKVLASEEEMVRNFGLLSMHSTHDAHIKEIKDLLDTLSVSRADDYNSWRDVLCVLGGTSASYKDLAEYFSRKSKKFNIVSFEKMWSSLTRGVNRFKKPLTLGSLHYWAKMDNPERYEQIRKNNVYSTLYNMVYEVYKEGALSHSDIAILLHQLLKHKFITDTPEGEKKLVWYEFILDEDDHIDGELYKWHRWNGFPVSLSKYISETLPNLFTQVLTSVKKKYETNGQDALGKYFNKVLQNFKTTMRKLGDHSTKNSIIAEAENKFNKRGFAKELDKDPLIRGVENGILKLSMAPGGKPLLIQGYHSYPVSKYTNVPYIPFNPHDPLTKEILIALRNLFPDDEPDSFEFTMSYLSSTIDGNPKESMFMIMVGKGANGKTFLVELHKSAIGETYGVKMPLSYLTCKSTSADNATPAQMMLKDASLACYSESNKHETLNAARVKEVTGIETLAGRKLHQDMVNFKPRCHHLVTTNYDFDIECNDHGTWRRIEYNPLKITFVDPSVSKIDPKDPYQRIANDTVTENWTEDPEVRGRYLGYMVWCNYWLYRKYRGKVKSVPHQHIMFETEKYRRRQDTISAFLAQRFIKAKNPEDMFNMTDEIQKYISWYSLNHGGLLPAKGLTEQFQNSQVGKYIKLTSRGIFLVGHRFLGNTETLGTGEEYVMKNIFDIATPEDNFGIKPETPNQFYERICKEYDQYKHIFDNKPTYDVDIHMAVATTDEASKGGVSNSATTPIRKNNVENEDVINGTILPSGIVLKRLEEPSLNYLTDEYHISMQGMLPDIGDIEA